MKTFHSLLFLVACSFLLSTCQSTKPSAVRVYEASEGVDLGYGKSEKNAITGSVSEIRPEISNLTLADYLRKVPGVRVTGSGINAQVVVRSVSTFTGPLEPLFILNGTPVGNSYSQIATLVDVNDIKSVSVLKDASSAAIYGARGSNGVIIISTKKK